MVLTEEQKERIRINRERALELQKQKKDPQSDQDCKASHKEEKFNGNARELKRPRSVEKEMSGLEEKEDLVDEELEMFEEGAPELVTKQEAMKMYCLPAGTLAVCEVVEKPNPRNGAWSKMKLYQEPLRLDLDKYILRD